MAFPGNNPNKRNRRAGFSPPEFGFAARVAGIDLSGEIAPPAVRRADCPRCREIKVGCGHPPLRAQEQSIS